MLKKNCKKLNLPQGDCQKIKRTQRDVYYKRIKKGGATNIKNSTKKEKTKEKKTSK